MKKFHMTNLPTLGLSSLIIGVLMMGCITLRNEQSTSIEISIMRAVAVFGSLLLIFGVVTIWSWIAAYIESSRNHPSRHSK
ncbi:OST5 family protein [Moritella sp. F3]|uniref:OST5 family protein n=1 Tax=Moritella sp. F3 TaxID=2718882 RepID=UPI0018E12315|nr:OST5 family protein [Moritella sp. F3]GIC77148.1 hypothetical protein FMO001_18750 [Moritella sp. F1]GIC77153.1 hypothetical protein FMO001_18800 [Moritella sp. F1]GIC82267.1 hypothetical protein FMO003_25480 [Moritella sp. F3]GIC82272.1 hypothetical protein FMO003_25530 [Moritella sp. F3]